LTLCAISIGCLVRLGDSASDIIQVDRSHFSVGWLTFLISQIADKIFE
jgi:hypothetical protein